MKKILTRTVPAIIIVIIICILMSSCTQMRLRAQARNSQLVVLDIGHYDSASKGGNGARTPDKRYGYMDEAQFWYSYVIYTKQVIEAAGYTCIITNRGAEPVDKKMAASGRQAGVIQINSPVVTGAYRSTQHPKRVAVGMLSVNYALDQKPACVVFLHHNSNSSNWRKTTTSAFYTNKEGVTLSQWMASVMTGKLLNSRMPNSGAACGIVIREDGRKGGGDWLNACNDHCVPAAITEVAYLNNPEHVQFLMKPANAIFFAQCVGEGIVKHLQNR